MGILRTASVGTLFFAFAAAPAHAEPYEATTLTASAIFAKAAAAYGTRAPGDYVETKLTHTPAADWTSVTVRRGEDYRTTITGGGFTSGYGLYQKHSWDQDDNGVVTLRENFHRKEDPNALAFEHPGDPKYNVRVLGITQDAPHEYAVELNPPDGFDEFCYFDVKTGFLSRIVEYTRDRYRHVEDYGDYRDSFGEWIPFRVHSYDGRPENDAVTTVESYVKAGADDDVTMPAGRALFSYAGTQPLTLPAQFTPQGIIVRAVVNGRGLDFVLDSGADGLVVDPGVARQLGLTPYGRSSATIGGGDVDIGEVRIPEMSVGGLDMHGVVFSTAGFEQQAGSGTRAVGLMGFDFFASGIIAIDFKAKTLKVYASDSFDPKALGLTALPLQLDDGVPRTDVWVEGTHGHFLVDTGSFQMLFYRDFAAKLRNAAVATNQAGISTVGGRMGASILDVNDVIFGGVKYDRAQVIEPNSSTFDVMDYDGLIGRDVLHNYQTYFDYHDGTLFVKFDP